jgi:hypothetical protein
MNIGVYITLLDDEYLIPYCFQAIQAVFPQVKVLDFGSTDRGCFTLPEEYVVAEGPHSPSDYIDLKNYYSSRHDRVFWVDADEIYPESSLWRMAQLLQTDQERIVTSWRCVKVSQNLEVSVEEPFIRGTSAWAPATNYLAREWPNEHLLHVDPDWQEKPEWQNTDIWCWHGVLLNRSSCKEGKGRYKKRLFRQVEADTRNKWSKSEGLPWGDLNLQKYVPIYQNIRSKKKRG